LTDLVVIVAIAAIVIVGYLVLDATAASAQASGMTRQISIAIGVAEGGYDASGNNLNNGTLPSRNHNPGDLTVDVNSTGSGVSGGFVVYPDDATGFAALDYQVGKWLDGSSDNATSASTIAQISQFYTTTDQAAWAANVASVLGVPVDTPLATIVGGASATLASTSTDPTQVADTSGDDSGADDGSQDDGSAQNV
jgi:hypothetical protein